MTGSSFRSIQIRAEEQNFISSEERNFRKVIWEETVVSKVKVKYFKYSRHGVGPTGIEEGLLASPLPSIHTVGLYFPASLAARHGHVTILPNHMKLEVEFACYSRSAVHYCRSGVSMACRCLTTCLPS